eukprot:TRINITY_DN762_c0_g1_i1.p1 TRINITY_DN762_c0_g1~~TRINITY_DN762_c0_g1_i1.p1  ORF type:complete len:386 (+),score=68.89 TRINITY_DN762_c0_g1_i1:108-1265(+)
MPNSIAFAGPIYSSKFGVTAVPLRSSAFCSWRTLPKHSSFRYARRDRAALVQLSASDEAPPDESLTEEEKEHQKLIKELEPKELKWSEIDFEGIQAELDAIDEYERHEDLSDEDLWPKFLRGAAYEHWGQPQLALAQYSKIPAGTQLSKVPQLWERKAYNSFKLGKVGEANAYCDIALTIYGQSVGNELHFAHWFQTHFEDYIPKWNGPHANIQRGICKYCVGSYKGTRESLVSQIALEEEHLEHAILWFLAASVKTATDGVALECDLKMVRKALNAERDFDPRLRLFIDLYMAHATGVFEDVAQIEERLSNEIKNDGLDDVVSKVYIALYHDAFTNDQAECDRAMDEVVALGSTRNQHDVENFFFFVAKNRLSSTGSEASRALK